MTGIAPTGSGLPTPQSLFATPAASTPAPIALTPAPADPALQVEVAGPTVTGPGGTTNLPAAAPADFQGVNPTPLDQPHPQYPALIQSHVAVLQAIGTPEHIIGQIAGTQPAADFFDRYIQGTIMQNLEGWDEYCGNPAGTARAGLTQLMPGVQLPAPGMGTPGVMPDGSRVDGINVPGVTQPLVAPEESAGNGLVKGLVIAAAVAGVGLLAWKFLKNRNPAEDAVKALGSGEGASGLMDAIDDVAKPDGLRRLLGGASAGGAGLLDDFGGSAHQAQRLVAMQAVVGGGGGNIQAGTHAAATLESIARGHGAANGFLNSVGASSVAFNQPFNRMADLALKQEALAVVRAAVDNGSIGELAAANFSLLQLGGQAAAGAGAKAGAVQQALAGVANALA